MFGDVELQFAGDLDPEDVNEDDDTNLSDEVQDGEPVELNASTCLPADSPGAGHIGEFLVVTGNQPILLKIWTSKKELVKIGLGELCVTC